MVLVRLFVAVVAILLVEQVVFILEVRQFAQLTIVDLAVLVVVLRALLSTVDQNVVFHLLIFFVLVTLALTDTLIVLVLLASLVQ